MVQCADSKDVKSFYKNLLAYIVVNMGLFIADWLGGGEWWLDWYIWTALIWGVALAFLGVYVFSHARRSGEGSARK